MREWLAKLAGAGDLAGQAGVRLRFDHELAPMWWPPILALCLLAAWLSYKRLHAPAWARATGIALRTLALWLLVLLLTGPRLVQSTERIERDWAIVLLDRSASLTIADAPAPSGGPVTRQQQLNSALATGAPAWTALAQQRQLVWLGFDAGLYDLPLPASPAAPVPALEAPTGPRTDLAQAIEGALARAAARPIAGIVIVSDGRATTPVPSALVRRLKAERVGLYVLPLGSTGPTGDVAIETADAPSTSFRGDRVPVRVSVSRTGSIRRASVQLVDENGRVLDEQPVQFDDAGQARRQVTLTGTPGAAGATTWTVRVTPDPGEADTVELVSDNNTQDVPVTLLDRPLRLMYIDGYPRWEYRFLKNVLSREPTLRFSATLLSPGRRYIAEGEQEVFTLPQTPAEWDQQDVFVLGDVQPGVFTPEQLAQLRQRVAVGGAGLLWIAGASAVPQAYAGTPLADLLPLVSTGGAGSERPATWDTDVTLRPTPLAEALGVLRLAERQPDGTFWPAQASDPSAGWSRLRWVQRLDRASLKPGAEALATVRSAQDQPGASAEELPGVLTMRYGAGRIVYVATDELWRYRYGRGEELIERFYLQLIRLLGREGAARAGQPGALQLTPDRAEVGGLVRVNLDLLDQALIDEPPAGVTVRIARTGAPEAEATTLTLQPDRAGTGAGALGRGRRSYSAVWSPGAPGTYVASATTPSLAGTQPARAKVAPAEDELRAPEADHASLKDLAEATGGQVLTPASLARLHVLLPRREARIVTTGADRTLWDRPQWLLLLVALLGAEWVLRRLVRLA